jgi:hypothetical protein
MIKKISFIVGAALLLGCSSSSGEKATTPEAVPMEKLESGGIPEGVRSNVTAKRRGRILQLNADGPSWFSFQVQPDFDELKIILSNDKGSADFIWSAKDLKAALDSGRTTLKVDLLLAGDSTNFYFNDGLRFQYRSNLIAKNSKLSVYLDGKLQNIPGILYDVGL